MVQAKLVFEIGKDDDADNVIESVTVEIRKFLENKAISKSSNPKIKNPNDPATEGQLSVLRKHKIPYSEGITKAEASEIIKKSMEENQ